MPRSRMPVVQLGGSMGLIPQLRIAHKLPLALIGSGLVIGAGIGIVSYLLSASAISRVSQPM